MRLFRCFSYCCCSCSSVAIAIALIVAVPVCFFSLFRSKMLERNALTFALCVFFSFKIYSTFMHPFERFRCETMYKMTQHIHSAPYYTALHCTHSMSVRQHNTKNVSLRENSSKGRSGMKEEKNIHSVYLCYSLSPFLAISFCLGVLFIFQFVWYSGTSWSKFLVHICNIQYTRIYIFVRSLCTFIITFDMNRFFVSFYLSACLIFHSFVLLACCCFFGLQFSWELFSCVQRTLFW